MKVRRPQAAMAFRMVLVADSILGLKGKRRVFMIDFLWNMDVCRDKRNLLDLERM